MAKKEKRYVLYYDTYNKDRRSVTVQLVLFQYALIITSMFIIGFYVSEHQIENRFFSTTFDGRMAPSYPLDGPNLTKPSLTSWLSQSLVNAMTFSHHDYRRRLRDASKAFTRRGWQEFTKYIKEQETIENMLTNRSVINASTLSAPLILQQGVYEDKDGRKRYFWQINIAISTVEKYNHDNIVKRLSLTINVVRVPKLDNANGIAIDSWHVS